MAKDAYNNDIKFRFCDSMGIEGRNEGMSSSDFAKIMDGHVKDGAEVSYINMTLILHTVIHIS